MIPIPHIHPMLVHFPIVLWIGAETLSLAILLRGGDVSARKPLALASLYALLIGTQFAVAAALFGDIALERAAAAGFAVAPIEEFP